MPGDVKMFGDRETAKDLRKRCPTSVDFLREMAGIDFAPRYQQRFAEAADELERLKDELVLFALITKERDELRAVVQEIDDGDNPDLWGTLVSQRNDLQTTLAELKAKLPKTKDGVAVVPLDRVWIVVDGAIEQRYVQWTAQPDLFVEWDYPGWLVSRGLDGPPVQVSHSWSTREAAEAAGEK
jgi:hypothetical protein